MLFYTYVHIRPDTGDIFYVGKGSGDRAHSHKNRNKIWRNVVNKNKGEFKVQILNWFNDPLTALVSEVWQIAKLKSLGHLVNLTPGGDNPPVFYGESHFKKKMSPERNREIALKSWATRKANGNDIAGDKNPMKRPEVAAKTSKTHKLLGENHHSKDPKNRAKMSAAQKALGENHPSRQEKNKIKNSQAQKERFLCKLERERVSLSVKRTRALRPELSRNHSILIKKKWTDPGYRAKMATRDWWNMNCMYQKYWGA